MSAPTYRLDLTGGQLRVLHETLAIIRNDPDWAETTAMTPREWAMLDRAAEAITARWRAAAKAESTPAIPTERTTP